MSYVHYAERAIIWPADFDKQGDIRLAKANHGFPAILDDGAGEDHYAVYRGVYQLCGEEGRDLMPTRVGTLRTTSKEVFEPGNKRLDPAKAAAPTPTKTAPARNRGKFPIHTVSNYHSRDTAPTSHHITTSLPEISSHPR